MKVAIFIHFLWFFLLFGETQCPPGAWLEAKLRPSTFFVGAQDMGITDLWLPPCTASVAPQGYLPSQLFNLDGSKYGSKE